MTRKLPISADDVSMWDNPQESPLVRQLLRAGRVDQVDYDVDAGLARHLANLQSSSQLPPWAIAQSTVQKGWSPALLAWLIPPVISATVVGAWLYLRPADVSPAALLPPPTAAATAAPSAQPELAARPLPLSPQPTSTAVIQSPSSEAVAELSSKMRAVSAVPNNSSLKLGRHTVASAVHRARGAHADLDAERVRTSGTATLGAEAVSGGAMHGAGPSAVSTTSSPAATSVNTAPSADDHADHAEAQQPAPTAAREPTAPAAPAAPAANERREPEPQAPHDNGISDARLEREMQMLAVAQRVLSSDPERSLRLTRQGEQEFRGSMFSAERTQVSLLALVQLGRIDEARRLGAPFLRAYPNAPWSARLREALATGRLPSTR